MRCDVIDPTDARGFGGGEEDGKMEGVFDGECKYKWNVDVDANAVLWFLADVRCETR